MRELDNHASRITRHSSIILPMFTRHRRGYDNAAGEVLSLERIGGGRFYLFYRLVYGDLAVKGLLDDTVGAQFDVGPGADLWGGPQIRLGVQEYLAARGWLIGFQIVGRKHVE